MAGVFLAYFSGSVLQTLPVGFLFLMAFDRKQYRLGAARTRYCYVLLDLCGCLAFAGVSMGIYTWWKIPNARVGSALLSVVVAVLVSYLWNCLARGTRGRMMALLLAVHYEAIVLAVNTALIELPGLPQRWPAYMEKAQDAAYGRLTAAGLLLITLITWPIASWFFGRLLRGFVEITGDAGLKRASICVAAAMGTTFLGLFIFVAVAPSYTLLFMIFSLLSNCVTYYLFLREVGEVRRSEALLGRVELLETQYRQISRHVQDMSRLRHDVRHHLRTIGVLNNEGRTEELKRYLEEFEVRYRETDSLPLCGYIPVDSMLHYYAARAAELKVRFTVRNHLRGDYPFPAVDMTVLLGNCLENAMEACVQSGEAMPQVEVDLQVINASFLLRIANSAQETEMADPDFEEYRPLASTKGRGRGSGLKSVDQIVKKYRGTMEIKRDRRQFALRVLLMMPDGEMSGNARL